MFTHGAIRNSHRRKSGGQVFGIRCGSWSGNEDDHRFRAGYHCISGLAKVLCQGMIVGGVKG
nr:hypothetical protein [Paenibacillus sp. PL91]